MIVLSPWCTEKGKAVGNQQRAHLTHQRVAARETHLPRALDGKVLVERGQAGVRRVAVAAERLAALLDQLEAVPPVHRPRDQARSASRRQPGPGCARGWPRMCAGMRAGEGGDGEGMRAGGRAGGRAATGKEGGSFWAWNERGTGLTCRTP